MKKSKNSENYDFSFDIDELRKLQHALAIMLDDFPIFPTVEAFYEGISQMLEENSENNSEIKIKCLKCHALLYDWGELFDHLLDCFEIYEQKEALPEGSFLTRHYFSIESESVIMCEHCGVRMFSSCINILIDNMKAHYCPHLESLNRKREQEFIQMDLEDQEKENAMNEYYMR